MSLLSPWHVAQHDDINASRHAQSVMGPEHRNYRHIHLIFLWGQSAQTTITLERFIKDDVKMAPQGAEESSLSSKTRQTPSYLDNSSILNCRVPYMH